jgi:hypothetical protein
MVTVVLTAVGMMTIWVEAVVVMREQQALHLSILMLFASRVLVLWLLLPNLAHVV